MARRTTLADKVRAFTARVLEGHGFRDRDHGIWLRESHGTGGIHAWAEPEVSELGGDVQFDLTLGVRVDAIERMLAQITGMRVQRYTPPTFVRPLSLLQSEGTRTLRLSGQRWRTSEKDRGHAPARVMDDFAAALSSSGMTWVERCASLDGLAEQMSAGYLDAALCWRLPVVHFHRSDGVRMREALELGTRSMAAYGEADAYRDFAVEMVRRLGDSPLDDTPCEAILSVLRPALRAAYPDRAATILVQLVRSFWWEPHSPSVEIPHCAFCGTTGAEAELMGAPLRICDTCVAAAFVLVGDATIPGSLRAAYQRDRSGYEYLRTIASGGSQVKAENLAADAVRALKHAAPDEADRLVPEIERRLLRAPGDRPPESVCMVCGPIRRPRWHADDGRPCSFCAREMEAGTVTVESGRAAICGACVHAFWPSVAEDRRLS